MRSIRWLTAALTMSALASLPVIARAQGERTEMLEKGRIAKGALSVTVDMGKASKLAFTATDFAYEVTSPRDLASGQASGKRQHKPVTVMADVGDWSVKLYQAMETNELINVVSIDLGAGHVLTLKSAHVTSVRLGADASGKVIQEVSFVGQAIEIK